MPAAPICWLLVSLILSEPPLPDLAAERAGVRIATTVDAYMGCEARDFDLMVHPDLVVEQGPDADLLPRILLHLEHDIDQIENTVPAPQLRFLRTVTIWVEKQGATVPGGMSGRGMCFHPSPEWLESHGLQKEKAGGVEIIRAADFPEWRKNQPWMLFHELSHAYHLFLGGGVYGKGYERDDIKECYTQAMTDGLYESVDYNMAADGKPRRAYAAVNPQEYFAELSEAYFGLNDYFPFTREQLRQHDPRGFALIERLWNLPAEELARLAAEGRANAARATRERPSRGQAP